MLKKPKWNSGNSDSVLRSDPCQWLGHHTLAKASIQSLTHAIYSYTIFPAPIFYYYKKQIEEFKMWSYSYLRIPAIIEKKEIKCRIKC